MHVPEGRRIFPELTVEENLLAAAYLVPTRAEVKRRLAEAVQRFPRLAERRTQAAGTLSGGEQQMLAFGRAMMTGPKLLLLDEPSLGLAPKLVEEVMKAVTLFRDAGVTVLLVEQNANLALRLADRGYVMETGRIVLQGTGAELLASEHVRASYLGGQAIRHGRARGRVVARRERIEWSRGAPYAPREGSTHRQHRDWRTSRGDAGQQATASLTYGRWMQ